MFVLSRDRRRGMRGRKRRTLSADPNANCFVEQPSRRSFAGVGDAPRRRLHVDVLRSTRSYGNDGDDDSVIINDGTGRSPYTLC